MLAWWLALAAAPDGEDLRRTPVVEAVEAATPAVVTIRADVAQRSPFSFDAPRGASEGSGVVIDPSGVVLTNAHVVAGARAVEVTLSDGRAYAAEIVAADGGVDLAVLRLQGASELPVITLGDSDGLLLGEPVVAIGNPYGLGLTVSTGVVASVGRDVAAGRGPLQTYIQTDAAINPGNSGGALVDVYGRLIGVNTFVHAAGEGIGFAIPVNRARKVADDLLRFGRVQLPWLGAVLAEAPRQRPPGVPPEGGAVLGRVLPDGPAWMAGLRDGDVLIEVRGHRVASRSDVNARLAEVAPGEAVEVVAVQAGVARRLRVLTRAPGPGLGQASLADVLGVEVSAVQGRLVVTRAAPGGTWARASLREGDEILAVDGRRVGGVEQLVEVLHGAKAAHRPRVWFTVGRDGARGSVEVDI